MRKCMIIFLISIVIMIISNPIVKANSTYTIQLEVTKNEEQKSFELYILLPEEYIKYAINKAGLDIQYTGAETLQKNTIPLIDVDNRNIQNETYTEGGEEYIQILLEPNQENQYTFEIIADYPDMNMKLRIKNEEKDFIMHIDNFKIEDTICQIEYNYDKNEIKQPTRIVINFGTLLLIIILIMIVMIGIIAKIKASK